MANDELVYVPVEALDPDPGNAKIHTEEQLTSLTESIRRFGFVDPIGAVLVGNRLLIVEGEGRWRAAQLAGQSTVPVIVLREMSEAEREGYALAHNRLQAMTKVDMGIVQQEVRRLDEDVSGYVSLGLDLVDFTVGETADNGQGGKRRKLTTSRSSSQLVFNSPETYNLWQRLLQNLRLRYLTDASVGEALTRFAQELSPRC